MIYNWRKNWGDDLSEVLVLGAGFGGLAAAVELRRLLPPEHSVTVVDRRDMFSMGFMNLWIMVGEKSMPRECLFPVKGVEKRGVRFINEEIVEIDPASRKVVTSGNVYTPDVVVVALGAEYAFDAVPGFREHAHNFYDLMGAYAAQNMLKDFTHGHIAILIAKPPYKCPPAPYEAALLIDSYMRRRGLRDKVEIDVYTPEPQPMPAAGPVGKRVEQFLTERGIRFHPRKQVKQIMDRRLVFEDGEAEFDLLLGVPPHRAPKPVRESPLVDETGWIPVNPQTMETRFRNVYAIGDVTSVKLPNGMFLPKAGVFAEAMALVAARRIAATLQNKPAEELFNGVGYCFFEVGEGQAGKIVANFFADPAPSIMFEPPSPRYRDEKVEFGNVRLSSWLL